MSFTLADLEAIVAARATASPDESWTAKLVAAGPQRIAKKFGEEAVEAATAAVTRLADGGELVEYLYLFPYAPATHARLLALLAARFTPVDKAAWPAFLQPARPGKETTALFTHGGYHISLGKPTDGDPAAWYSNVIFEKVDKPALGVRKVCRDGGDA